MYSRKLPRRSVSRRPPPGRLARLGPSPVFKRLEPTLALEMGYLRALYDWPADGFDLDFRDRAAAQQIFEEGQGSLLTDGTRACMEASHLQYDQLLDAESGARGLRLLMDGDGITCGHSAQIAVGHLASWQGYSYGDFSWVARVAHSPGGGKPPSNVFSCFSTFVHGSLAHNELAWCFPAHDGSEVHMSYWFDEEMHRTARRLRFDATAGFHKYETRWRPQGIDWMVDGAVVHQVRGTAGKDIPWELMSMRVIIRPRNTPSVLLGVAHLELMQARFIPLGAEASPVTNAPSRQTPPPPPPPPPPLRRHPPPVPSPPRERPPPPPLPPPRPPTRSARVAPPPPPPHTPPTTAPPPSPPPSAPPPRTQRQPPPSPSVSTVLPPPPHPSPGSSSEASAPPPPLVFAPPFPAATGTAPLQRLRRAGVVVSAALSLLVVVGGWCCWWCCCQAQAAGKQTRPRRRLFLARPLQRREAAVAGLARTTAADGGGRSTNRLVGRARRGRHGWGRLPADEVAAGLADARADTYCS